MPPAIFFRIEREGRVEFYARAAVDQAKEIAKGCAAAARARRGRSDRPEKKFACPVLNRFCTLHPQDFHSSGGPARRGRRAGTMQVEFR